MKDNGILESWKEISAYLKRSVKTCRHWARELGLPVHRLEDSPKAHVFAYKEEIDHWLEEKLEEPKMARDLGKYQEAAKTEAACVFNIKSLLGHLRKPFVAIPTVLAVIGIALIIHWFVNRQAKIRWAYNVALPQVEPLIIKEDYTPAWELIKRLEKVIPNNAWLQELAPKASREISASTTPAGADIFLRDYADVQSEWTFMGRSPIHNAKISRSPKRWKIIKAGYLEFEGSEIIEGSAFVRLTPPIKIDVALNKTGTIPEEMVRIKTGEWKDMNGQVLPGYVTTLLGLKGHGPVQLEDYLLDRYEVTNRKFKAFIDAGGYRKKEYWKNEFVKEGKTISWQEAMTLFVDKTGQPGPADWELSNFPEGKDEYPVTGVSWHEAAAYAEFARKSLPTVYHWNYAAGTTSSCLIIPMSNFGDKGISPVGQNKGIGPFGTYDMAGNVREWCWNEADGKRFTLGGAWEEQPYMFYSATAMSPFSRAPNQGLRCMKYLSAERLSKDIWGPISPQPGRNLVQEKPVSDEVFNVIKSFYLYPKYELDAVIEARDESPKNWVKEKISFNAAYGKERIIVYLFLPRDVMPPYQAVVWFPGGGASVYERIEDYSATSDAVDFIVKSGRAVVYPIYKGTFERRIRADQEVSDRDLLIMLFRDLASSINYLETRKDIDSLKIGYTSYSWGSYLASFFLALETRIKAAILVSGGFLPSDQAPELEQLNFMSRVKTPTLMLNGRFDYFQILPDALSMFRLLGTPEADKKHVIYDSDHSLPREARIKETLAWLDKYLGPVK